MNPIEVFASRAIVASKFAAVTIATSRHYSTSNQRSRLLTHQQYWKTYPDFKEQIGFHGNDVEDRQKDDNDQDCLSQDQLKQTNCLKQGLKNCPRYSPEILKLNLGDIKYFYFQIRVA